MTRIDAAHHETPADALRSLDAVPWCEPCSRFWTQPSANRDGTCPSCGSVLVNPAGIDRTEASPKAPWHFKLLVLAVVVYLAWRVVQMVGWAVG